MVEMARSQSMNEKRQIAKDRHFRPTILGQTKSMSSPNRVEGGRKEKFNRHWHFLGKCKEAGFE